ncbi:MAG: 50S ribosomal protein L3 [Salinisphaera sp.]|nr:50S ribosomal protein L3 [Salinisphaera sp.]
MSMGLIGRKCGMTRVFTDTGATVPVTVVEVSPNRVTQIKDIEPDGYRAVQVTTGARRATRVNRAMAGHYKRAATTAGRGLWEFRLGEDEALPTIRKKSDTPATAESEDAGQAAEPAFEETEVALGAEFTVNLFAAGQVVDVTGTSIGKGYAGVIKRHNFSSQRMTHGNSKAHRAPGSIGQNQTPGRVFKGKKMSGHMGDARTTVQNLEVVRVDEQRNLLLIRGGVPGAKGSDLIIRPAVKKD